MRNTQCRNFKPALARMLSSRMLDDVTRILAEDSLSRSSRQLRKHGQRDGALGIPDLVGKVGAEHDALGAHETDQKAQRRGACHDGVVIELPQVLAWRLRDMRAAGGIRLVLGRAIGEIEASPEVGQRSTAVGEEKVERGVALEHSRKYESGRGD